MTKSLAGAVALCSVALLPFRAHAAGEIYWFSLLTEDIGGASQFYSELFGWDIVQSPTGGLMALRNGQPFAGMNRIEDRIPGTSESLWLAAIAVTDPAQSVATAKKLGATIRQDVIDLPGWGTYSVIQDPQGAPLLLGARGRPVTDVKALARVLSQLSQFAAEVGPRLRSVDLNPVFAMPEGQGAWAADAVLEVEEVAHGAES